MSRDVGAYGRLATLLHFVPTARLSIFLPEIQTGNSVDE